MSNDQYLIINFPFETDTNDKCKKLTWTKTGTLSIQNTSSLTDFNNNTRFSKAMILKSKNSLLKSNKFDFGGQNFTIECWSYSISDQNKYFFNLRNSQMSQIIIIGYQNSAVAFFLNNSFHSDKIMTSNFLNTWHHTACCYIHNQSKLYCYVDGQLNQINNFSLNKDSTIFFEIGCYYDSSFINSYIKDVKIYNGIALYTNDYIDNIGEFRKTEIINNNTKRSVNTNYKQINYKSFEFM